MALATWWSADPLPNLPELSGFWAGLASNDAALAILNRLSVSEVRARRGAGHHPYIGRLDGLSVAYGWVATEEAAIGELQLTIRLPRGNRYLWDFATLPGFQGRGLYPHLLQAILWQERPEAERFWIIHAPENLPSGAGMAHAGLLPVGHLSFRPDGRLAIAPLGSLEQARAGADLLGVPLLNAELAPCWHCGAQMAASEGALQIAPCWPPATMIAVPCTCAIPRRLHVPGSG